MTVHEERWVGTTHPTACPPPVRKRPPLEILEDEVRSAMGLLGATRLSDLDPTYVQRGTPAVSTPSVLSAFPLLGPEGDGR